MLFMNKMLYLTSVSVLWEKISENIQNTCTVYKQFEIDKAWIRSSVKLINICILPVKDEKIRIFFFFPVNNFVSLAESLFLFLLGVCHLQLLVWNFYSEILIAWKIKIDRVTYFWYQYQKTASSNRKCHLQNQIIIDTNNFSW